ncbi:MAG: hypothetical protein ACLQVD_07180 [Capsulimonadaceae bacterium]
MLRILRVVLTLSVIMIVLSLSLLLTSAATAAAGSSVVHILWSNTKGTLSLWDYNPSTQTYVQDIYGPFPGWTAQSVADGPDGLTRVMWVNTSGAVSIWSQDSSTGAYTQDTFGPYKGWTATAMSVSGNNTTHVLWTDGSSASVWDYTGGTTYTQYTFGPFPGWSAVALSDGLDGLTRVLWVDAGSAAIWSLDPTAGTYTQTAFGPFSGWTATAVSVNAANITHVLWTNTSGAASVWSLGAKAGTYTQNSFPAVSGWKAVSMADGWDGNTQVLWDSCGGQSWIWDLSDTSGAYTQGTFGPFAGWTATGLTANNTPIPDLGDDASLNGKRVFPLDNAWNTPIDTDTVDPNSATLVATIGDDSPLHPDFGSDPDYGIPYVVVSNTQPYVPIDFTLYGDQSDPGPYPVPPDAPIEGGSSSTGDRHVLVVDRDTWELYEMYYAFPENDGASWDAGSGATWNLNSDALRPAGWTSADAAGLPIFPGLVRYDEVQAGFIGHAIRFTAPQTLDGYIAPARHCASSLTGSQYPPMGMRVRLKASFDISSFPADDQVILTAMKTYGMILADNGSSWFFQGAYNPNWNDNDLDELKTLTGSDFEVVTMGTITIGN